MAHSKQAQKRIRTSDRRRIHNKGIATRMRTEVKRLLTSIEEGRVDEAKAALPSAMMRIDKAAKANILHKNAAANRKSMLARAIQRASA